jgi:hypothetical protein
MVPTDRLREIGSIARPDIDVEEFEGERLHGKYGLYRYFVIGQMCRKFKRISAYFPLFPQRLQSPPFLLKRALGRRQGRTFYEFEQVLQTRHLK